MIDDLTILLSTLTCLFVAYRAVKLDRITPWFGERPKRPPADRPVAAAARDPSSGGTASNAWRARRVRRTRDARAVRGGSRGGGAAPGARAVSAPAMRREAVQPMPL